MIKEITRVRDNTLSRLDLFITSNCNDIKNFKYLCALGKSDHLIEDMEILGKYIGEREETYW